MNITFVPFDKRKEKTSLRAFVYHRGREYRISVGESVLTKYWNENKNRCKLVREYPEGPYINKSLDEIEKIITGIINSYGLVTPVASQVKTDYKNYRKNMNIEAGGAADNEENQYLVNFAVKFKNESDRSKSTRVHYETTINKLIEYQNKFSVKLRFADIDINFYNKFKKWLLNQTYTNGSNEYHYSKNYIGTIFKNIKTFMNESRRVGIHSFSGFEHRDFKVESEQTDSIYLNMNEIEKIYNLKFTEELLIENGYDVRPQNLHRAIISLNEERDRFLIGCFTALRHSDYSRLESLHFNDNMIAVWTKKKDKKVYIPMHHLLRKILERRQNELPPAISDQKHNEQIKEIGRLAGINDETLLTKTRGGSRENIIGKKYEFITSHTARRSGATNMYLAGIDIKFIQDILGHSKVEQTLKYIKVSAEDNAKRLQNHPYFTGKN
ncbi:MAG: site-specific integrase [Candidatus Azobacteroides sp.]|nr:site-specific integrase [Candidatus Azobacteroides sp.]